MVIIVYFTILISDTNVASVMLQLLEGTTDEHLIATNSYVTEAVHNIPVPNMAVTGKNLQYLTDMKIKNKKGFYFPHILNK